MCLSQDDDNMKKYHKFVEQRRVINSTWEITSMNGEFCITQTELGRESFGHFQAMY